MSTELSTIIKTATSNLPQNDLNGGIFYIHSNIPENQFNYEKSLYVSVYLAIMTINDNLKNISTQEMIDTLASLGFAGTKE